MTITEMIKRFGLVLAQKDGQEAIRVDAYCKPTAKQVEEIRANKQEIIAELKSQKAEKEAKEKATIRFTVPGWESHEISVDTRHDVDEQLRNWAEYYSNDMTYETAKAAYEKAIGKEAEKAEKEAANTAKAKAEKEAIFAKAKATGKKQVLRTYMDECDGTAYECSYDAVTVYAMPDGSTTQTRIHTH